MRAPLLIAFAVLAAALSAGGPQGSSDGFRRERDPETAAKKDALEGTAPPQIVATEWLNAPFEKFDWKRFKGKVVLIDFWAFW